MDKRLRFMTDLIAPLKVEPGSEVRLSRDHEQSGTHIPVSVGPDVLCFERRGDQRFLVALN